MTPDSPSPTLEEIHVGTATGPAHGTGQPARRAPARHHDRDGTHSDGDLVSAAERIGGAGGRRWSEVQLEPNTGRAVEDLELDEPTPRPAAKPRSLVYLIGSRHR
jgi:hypothetical protein